jgi:hypothetical protein
MKPPRFRPNMGYARLDDRTARHTTFLEERLAETYYLELCGAGAEPKHNSIITIMN